MDNIMFTFKTVLLLGLFTIASNLIFAQDDGVDRTGQIGKKDLQFVDQQGGIVTYPRMNQYGDLLFYSPIVSTDSIPEGTIDYSKAVVWGNVWHHGWAEPITHQGFQVCTNNLFETYTESAYTPCGVGVFYTLIQGLSPNTQYYVRAYAKNSQGISYGDTMEFSTSGISSMTITGISDTMICPSSTISITYTAISSFTDNFEWSCSGGIPTTSTTNSYSVTYNTAGTYTVSCTVGGSSATFTTVITAGNAPTLSVCNDETDGSATASTDGIRYLWKNSAGDSITNAARLFGQPAGTYTVIVNSNSGCTASTTVPIAKIVTWCDVYYKNNSESGTSNRIDSVKGHDNNWYEVVQIGNRCWLRENIKATTLPSGRTLSELNGLSSYNATTPTYFEYGGVNKAANVAVYGRLYNWVAALDTNGSSFIQFKYQHRGICPEGWHIPTAREWEYLIDVENTKAGMFAGSCLWESSSVSETPGNYSYQSRNSTKFSALPAGYFSLDNYNNVVDSSACTGLGESTYFVMAGDSTTPTFARLLSYDQPSIVVSNNIDTNNIVGMSVRCVRDSLAPAVITSNVSDLEATTFTCGGEVTHAGDAPVTARGILWSTHPNPTFTDNVTTEGTGTGSFASIVNCVTLNTTYYVRAYATNKYGTTYGDEISFTTPNFNCGTSSVCDYEGNIYRTVKMGSQCWLRDNLISKKYADGRSIDGFDDQYIGTINYTWDVAMDGADPSESNPSGVRGVCPVGWHVPSSAEWIQMENFVADSFDVSPDYEGLLYIAKLLADTTSWWGNSSEAPPAEFNTPGNEPSTNNASGFSIVPSHGGNEMGDPNDGYSYHNYAWESAFFWTATAYDEGPDYRRIEYYSEYIESGYEMIDGELIFNPDNTYDYMAIRCVRDSAYPFVNTAAVSNIGITTANCGGNVTLSGDAPVIARGVCWSTSPNPTVADNHTIDGSGEGSFTSTITDLTANTKYYIRAYATNALGTAYGAPFLFMTRSTCTVSALGDNESGNGTRLDSLRDVDNNWYDVVQIGSQCWLKENLRTKRYADNNTISKGVRTTSSLSTAYYYYPQNDSANVASYGLLYNWAAVKGSGDSSATNPSGVQGICPNGWHVPSSAEWAALGTYVDSLPQYRCSGSNSTAKAIASMIGWDSSSITCVVGNNLSENNATGLSLMAAGNMFGTANINEFADLWTITSNSTESAESFNLYYSNNTFPTCHANPRSMGFSVRCIRD